MTAAPTKVAQLEAARWELDHLLQEEKRIRNSTLSVDVWNQALKVRDKIRMVRKEVESLQQQVF